MNYTLNKEIAELKQHLEFEEKLVPEVSSTSVAWHIDHSLRVISTVCKSIAKSDPTEYRYKRNKNRTKIKLIGYIPRGLGKAPEAVLPNENIDKDHLLIRIEQCKELLVKFDQLESNAYFKHPIFGGLNKKNTKWFIKLHTKHHLKIIRDIIKF